MIKKYMKELYEEVEQIRRKLDGGHMKYFGCKDFGNASCYTVILKNGTYFAIALGTKFVPPFKKSDVIFISKQVSSNSLSENWGKWVEYVDTERGRTRYDWSTAYSCVDKYETSIFNKYKIDFDNELDTGWWD